MSKNHNDYPDHDNYDLNDSGYRRPNFLKQDRKHKLEANDGKGYLGNHDSYTEIPKDHIKNQEPKFYDNPSDISNLKDLDKFRKLANKPLDTVIGGSKYKRPFGKKHHTNNPRKANNNRNRYRNADQVKRSGYRSPYQNMQNQQNAQDQTNYDPYDADKQQDALNNQNAQMQNQNQMQAHNKEDDPNNLNNPNKFDGSSGDNDKNSTDKNKSDGSKSDKDKDSDESKKDKDNSDKSADSKDDKDNVKSDKDNDFNQEDDKDKDKFDNASRDDDKNSDKAKDGDDKDKDSDKDKKDKDSDKKDKSKKHKKFNIAKHLKPRNPTKRFRDFLKLAKRLNKDDYDEDDKQKIKNLIARFFNMLKRMIKVLFVFIEALRLYLLYKLLLLLKALLNHVLGWIQHILNGIFWVGTHIGTIMSAVGIGLLPMLSTVAIGLGTFILCVILVLWNGSQDQSNQMRQLLYQELCTNRKSKSDDGADDSSGGDIGSSKTQGKAKPIKFSNGKTHFDTVKNMCNAVGKKLGIKPRLLFAQIWSEASPYVNGPGIPVNRLDHNLAGVSWGGSGDPYEKGTPHGEGDGYYRRYKNFQEFAGDWARVLQNDFHKMGGKPKSVSDYAHRLKLMGYYTAPEDQYRAQMEAGWNQWSKSGQFGGSSASDTMGSEIKQKVSDAIDDFCDGMNDKKEDAGSGWIWPFATVKGKNAHVAYMDGGQFGVTSFPRSTTNFHDGFDWSNGLNGVHFPMSVHAIHAGKIHKVGFVPKSAYWYIWEKAGKYNIIYQEGFESRSSIKVKEGDTVSRNQVIGTADSSRGHVHLGITTNAMNPAMNQTQSPVADGYDHPKEWLNPIKVIRNGFGSGGSSAGSGDTSIKSSYAHKVMMKESTGNYTATNGKYYGAWQLDISYLKNKTYGGDGTLSRKNQDRVAINYMKARYGSWKKAWAHECSANWW